MSDAHSSLNLANLTFSLSDTTFTSIPIGNTDQNFQDYRDYLAHYIERRICVKVDYLSLSLYKITTCGLFWAIGSVSALR